MKNDFNKIFHEWEKSNKIINKDLNINNKIKNTKKNNTESFIDLHLLRKIEAIEKLNQFIIDNMKKNIKKIKIIHGIGRHSNNKSIIKESVKQFLNSNKHIRYYRPGRIGEGGAGVTIAFIK